MAGTQGLKDRLPIAGATYDPDVINNIIDILEQAFTKPQKTLLKPGYVKTATYNMDPSVDVIFADYTSTGACTINLASATLCAGRQIIIEDSGALAATHNITVAGSGSDTINGSSTYVISVDRGFIILVPNGATDWKVVSEIFNGGGPAAAGTLTGTTLASGVVNSSLTSIGELISIGGTSPVSDGTYTVGLGLTTNGTITTKGGIITAVTQAS